MQFQPKDSLTEYESSTITLFRRKDCNPFGGSPGFLRQLLKNIPNAHPKLPDVKQRTPNVAVDNFCLFKNSKGQLCTIIGNIFKKILLFLHLFRRSFRQKRYHKWSKYTIKGLGNVWWTC